MTPPVSIGFVARSRRDPTSFAGHAARCKVYRTYRTALAAVRWPDATDLEVLARYEVLEAFIQPPEYNAP